MGIHYPEITHLCDGCYSPSLATTEGSDIRWTPLALEDHTSDEGSWLCFSCYGEEVDRLKEENFKKLKLLKVYLEEYEKRAEAKNATKKT